MPAKRIRLAGLCAALVFSGAVTFGHVTHADAQGKKAAPAVDDKKEEAKTAFTEASKKFDEGDFAGALPLFQKADDLYPGAAPKHKIAICRDKLGNATEAIAAYKAFVASDPGEKYADRIAEANQRIGELEATLPATVTIAVAPEGIAAQITVDGNPASGTELTLPAGEHTIVVTAEGHEPLTEVVTVRGSETRTLTLTLTPIAAAPPPPVPAQPQPTEDEGRSNVPAYVTLGIAGAGVILGTVFGIQALSAKSNFDDEPTADNADDAERAALIADMSFGVALTFGITGAVLLFSGGDDDEPEETTTSSSATPKLVPLAGPKGGGMMATWRF